MRRVPTRRKGAVEKAVFDELKAMPADLRGSGLAAAALALARDIDTPGNSATSRSMCARELREHLDRLRELAPPKKERDRLDDLKDSRVARLDDHRRARA